MDHYHIPGFTYVAQPTPAWQCPRCQAVRTGVMGGTASVDSWCACYSMQPGSPYYVDRLHLTQMTPLNEEARSIDAFRAKLAADQASAREAERARQRAYEEELDSWGWAPAAQPRGWQVSRRRQQGRVDAEMLWIIGLFAIMVLLGIVSICALVGAANNTGCTP